MSAHRFRYRVEPCLCRNLRDPITTRKKIPFVTCTIANNVSHPSVTPQGSPLIKQIITIKSGSLFVRSYLTVEHFKFAACTKGVNFEL